MDSNHNVSHFRDEDGSSYIIQSLMLRPFSAWERYPVTLGHRGVIDISFANGVLGMRFGAESFTSLMPLAK